jgi:phosphoglycerate dehydrogenase-like enzyme
VAPVADLIVRVHDKDGRWLAERIARIDPRIAVTQEPPEHGGKARTCLVAFTPPDDEDIGAYDWIHASGAGVDRILPRLRASGGRPVITRTTGRMGRQIGEYALSYALAFLQKHRVRQELASERRWSVEEASPRLLFETDVLVIGTGEMGQGIARVFAPHARQVLGASKSGRAKPPFDQTFPLAELPAQDGIIAIAALPATPDSEDALANAFFSRLANSLFINTGRGLTVDDRALAEWLGRDEGSAAVLDVFKQEPLPPDHPAWAQERVTVTPHVSGITRAEDTLEAFTKQARRYLEGNALEDTVDIERGY